MQAYGWTSAIAAVLLLAALLATLIGGRLLDRTTPQRAQQLAWMWLPGLLLVVHLLAQDQPAGARMLALVAATFLAMKNVALATARSAGMQPLPRGRWLWFTLCWFGMDPRPFGRRWSPRGGSGPLVRRGLQNCAAGAVLIVIANALGARWATLLLLVGISLVLHFGLFTLSTAAFRTAGCRCRLLFDAPLRARTLDEFWSRRWNTGFAEMMALCVQRPLARTVGRRRALLAAFGLSGLLHEVAISLPVQAGFGLPTAYFVLQGLLVCSRLRPTRRVTTLLAVVVPLPLVSTRGSSPA